MQRIKTVANFVCSCVQLLSDAKQLQKQVLQLCYLKQQAKPATMNAVNNCLNVTFKQLLATQATEKE